MKTEQTVQKTAQKIILRQMTQRQDNTQTDAKASMEESTQDNTQSENGEQKESEPLAKETVDAWLATFRSNPQVLNDTDGNAGITGLKDGTVQAKQYRMRQLMTR